MTTHRIGRSMAVIAAALLALLVAAPIASAKEGIEVALAAPIPADAQPGDVVQLVFTARTMTDTGIRATQGRRALHPAVRTDRCEDRGDRPGTIDARHLSGHDRDPGGRRQPRGVRDPRDVHQRLDRPRLAVRRAPRRGNGPAGGRPEREPAAVRAGGARGRVRAGARLGRGGPRHFDDRDRGRGRAGVTAGGSTGPRRRRARARRAGRARRPGAPPSASRADHRGLSRSTAAPDAFRVLIAGWSTPSAGTVRPWLGTSANCPSSSVSSSW